MERRRTILVELQKGIAIPRNWDNILGEHILQKFCVGFLGWQHVFWIFTYALLEDFFFCVNVGFPLYFLLWCMILSMTTRLTMKTEYFSYMESPLVFPVWGQRGIMYIFTPGYLARHPHLRKFLAKIHIKRKYFIVLDFHIQDVHCW